MFASSDKELQDMISEFGLQEVLAADCLSISGGEAVLVSLACGLLSKKSIMVADCPTDSLSKRRLEPVRAAMLKAISSGRKTCLLEAGCARGMGNLISSCDPSPVITADKVADAQDGITSGSQTATPVVRGSPQQLESSVLRLRNVDITIGKRPLLSAVSFDVAPQEIVGLCGDNGTGKTSLLRVAAGLESPAAGKVGRSGPVRMSFQSSAAQSIARTVEEELAIYQRLNGDDPGAAEALRVAATHLPLPPLGASIGSLSPAQRRWVCIAAMLPAATLLLDEPNVDWGRGRVAAMACLRALCRGTNLALVVVSHDTAILDACDRVIDIQRWTPRRRTLCLQR
jgi:heme exporter protein A